MNEVQRFFYEQNQKKIAILSLDAAMMALEPRCKRGDVEAINQTLELSIRKLTILGILPEEE